MTPENFCYWLQGLLELSNPTTLDETQINIIKDHLEVVFKKETPAYSLKNLFNQAQKNKGICPEIEDKPSLNITC